MISARCVFDGGQQIRHQKESPLHQKVSRMLSDPQIPQEIQSALKKGLLQRLPLTVRPSINEQIRGWEFLFPFEHRNIQQFFGYLGGLDDSQFGTLFRSIREIEGRMGVAQWNCSARKSTIENASLLARSPYYGSWRREVQRVFDQINKHASQRESLVNRLVILIIPNPLPVDSITAWKRWQGIGRALRLDLSSNGNLPSLSGTLAGNEEQESWSMEPNLLRTKGRILYGSVSDVWYIDAGTNLLSSILGTKLMTSLCKRAVLLSFDRLKLFREKVLQ